MNKIVSIKKIKEDAQEYFSKGTFYCSEAIVASIRQNIMPEMPVEIISVASGFPAGIGRSKCVCGAVSGGVICIGYFFGRTVGEVSSDERVKKTLKLANELQQYFRDNHKGTLCCSYHTKGFDMASGEHKNQCQSFTGEMAEKTGEIIARELGLDIVN